jgi:hypothetical protein
MQLLTLIRKLIRHKLGIDKLLPNTCPIKKSLKLGNAFSSQLFNFALQRVITRIQEVSGGPGRLELDVTHQLLVYADDVDILGESKRTVNENTGIYWSLIGRLF